MYKRLKSKTADMLIIFRTLQKANPENKEDNKIYYGQRMKVDIKKGYSHNNN